MALISSNWATSTKVAQILITSYVLCSSGGCVLSSRLSTHYLSHLQTPSTHSLRWRSICNRLSFEHHFYLLVRIRCQKWIALLARLVLGGVLEVRFPFLVDRFCVRSWCLIVFDGGLSIFAHCCNRLTKHCSNSIFAPSPLLLVFSTHNEPLLAPVDISDDSLQLRFGCGRMVTNCLIHGIRLRCAPVEDLATLNRSAWMAMSQSIDLLVEVWELAVPLRQQPVDEIHRLLTTIPTNLILHSSIPQIPILLGQEGRIVEIDFFKAGFVLIRIFRWVFKLHIELMRLFWVRL